jgi:hypothetical protein
MQRTHHTLCHTRLFCFVFAGDHKPVYAVYNARVACVVKSKRQAVTASLHARLDQWENECVPKIDVTVGSVARKSDTDADADGDGNGGGGGGSGGGGGGIVDVGDVDFDVPVTATFSIRNTGLVPAKFSFVPKNAFTINMSDGDDGGGGGGDLDNNGSRGGGGGSGGGGCSTRGGRTVSAYDAHRASVTSKSEFNNNNNNNNNDNNKNNNKNTGAMPARAGRPTSASIFDRASAALSSALSSSATAGSARSNSGRCCNAIMPCRFCSNYLQCNHALSLLCELLALNHARFCIIHRI